jgi:hypothetical protein
MVVSIIIGSIPLVVAAVNSNNEKIVSETEAEAEEEPPSIQTSTTIITTTTILTTTITTTETTVATTTTAPTNKIDIYENEYPVAKQVWDIMKSYGWNDNICAGILGNMMRECGGDTFNLQWNIIGGNSHYGLCQWSIKYHKGAWYLNVEDQVEYLKNTLDISIFDECSTPEEAAYIFCKVYERPGQTDPIGKRRANARRAYDYFVG